MAKKKADKKVKKASSKAASKISKPFSERVKDLWKSPVYRFLGLFTLFVAVFYAIYYSSFFERFILDPYVNFLAKVSSLILNIFGAGTTVAGDDVVGPDFSVSIKNGCDGMEVMAMFLAAVVAFPIARKLKWPGIFAGTVFLFLLNIVRIMALYLTGVYAPSFFDAMHIQGGFIVFTIVCMAILLIWANWALGKEKQMRNAGA